MEGNEKEKRRGGKEEGKGEGGRERERERDVLDFAQWERETFAQWEKKKKQKRYK